MADLGRARSPAHYDTKQYGQYAACRVSVGHLQPDHRSTSAAARRYVGILNWPKHRYERRQHQRPVLPPGAGCLGPAVGLLDGAGSHQRWARWATRPERHVLYAPPQHDHHRRTSIALQRSPIYRHGASPTRPTTVDTAPDTPVRFWVNMRLRWMRCANRQREGLTGEADSYLRQVTRTRHWRAMLVESASQSAADADSPRTPRGGAGTDRYRPRRWGIAKCLAAEELQDEIAAASADGECDNQVGILNAEPDYC